MKLWVSVLLLDFDELPFVAAKGCETGRSDNCCRIVQDCQRRAISEWQEPRLRTARVTSDWLHDWLDPMETTSESTWNKSKVWIKRIMNKTISITLPFWTKLLVFERNNITENHKIKMNNCLLGMCPEKKMEYIPDGDIFSPSANLPRGKCPFWWSAWVRYPFRLSSEASPSGDLYLPDGEREFRPECGQFL